MLINSKQVIQKIKKQKAACAFNFSTIEVAEAIVMTAASLKTPFILQASQSETSFLNPEIAQSIASYLSKKYSLSISLNLDHGQDLKLIQKCVEFGYSSIHFDGSQLPLKENIQLTKKVVRWCRKKGISVEGEVGVISGSSSLKESPEKQILTKPEEAVQYIKETNVDFLAISIGEKHGLGVNHLRFNLLKKISSQVGKLPLVLHGGSGISPQNLKRAIKLGIKKINFNTDLRLAWTQSLRKYLKKHPNEIVPYKILSQTKNSVSQIVEEKLKICSI